MRDYQRIRSYVFGRDKVVALDLPSGRVIELDKDSINAAPLKAVNGSGVMYDGEYVAENSIYYGKYTR